MALSSAQKFVLARTLAASCTVFESGLIAPAGLTPDAAANAIASALTSINANSADTPKGKDFRATLLRVEALTTAPHIEAHANEAATWVTSAAALL